MRTHLRLFLTCLAALPVGCGSPRADHPTRTEGSAGSSAANPIASAASRVARAADPANSVRSVAPWPFEDVQGRVIRTDHYAIYTTETEPIITDRLPGFMEAALPQYAGAIAPLGRPSVPFDLFVMASRPQWERLTLRMLGQAGVPVTNTIERGGFTTGGRAFLFDIGAADTFSIAAHEGWHQFSQLTLRERIPLWLEEGLATFFEGHRWIGPDVVFLPWCNLERFDRLREAATPRKPGGPSGLLGLREVMAASPQGLMSGAGPGAGLTYYAQVWALVHYLREGQGGKYRRGLEQLLADAARGTLARAIAQAGPPARGPALLPDAHSAAIMRTYFGGDFDAFARGYDEFIREIVKTGTRGEIVEGRSPIR